MNVLVVDDAAANRRVLALLIGRLGHEVRAVGTAGEALAAFRAAPADAVLSDLHLAEGTDGIRLVAALRAVPGGAAARCALVTADPPQAKLADLGVDAVLQKPVALADLKAFLDASTPKIPTSRP